MYSFTICFSALDLRARRKFSAFIVMNPMERFKKKYKGYEDVVIEAGTSQEEVKRIFNEFFGVHTNMETEEFVRRFHFELGNGGRPLVCADTVKKRLLRMVV